MEQRRIFVGGLKPGVTDDDLHEKFSRFGEVTQIEIKTRNNETENKAFAYINLTTDENGFKKCFSAYNNTKWKGGQLKLQFAKESFLEKLKQEQLEAKAAVRLKTKPAVISPALKEVNVKAVPGTPMDEQGKWVIGKYSRVLPVLHLKKPNSKKLVTLDPSKTTHALKKLKSDDMETDLDSSKLTWTLEEKDDDLSRKRQGIFPERQNTKKKKPDVSAILRQIMSEHGDNTELEVVPLGKSLSKLPDSSSKSRGYDSDSSAHSADTDEILTASTAKKPVKIASRSSTQISSNSLGKVSGETPTDAAKISKPLETPKTTSKTAKAPETDKNPTPTDKSQTTPKNSTKKAKLQATTKASASTKEKAKNLGKIDMCEDVERDKKSSLTDSTCMMTSGSPEARKPATGKLASEASSGEEDVAKEALHPEPQFKFVKATAQGKCFRLAASLSKTPPFRGLGSLLDSRKVSKNDGETELSHTYVAGPSAASKSDLCRAESQSDLTNSVKEAFGTSPTETLASIVNRTVASSTNVKTVSKQPVPSKPHHSSAATSKLSAPAALVPRKRTWLVAGSDDSDLDDNDFERVCKKLAAREKEKDEKSGGVPAASGSSRAASYEAVKDISDETVQETTGENSHLAWKKNKEALVKQEKLVTKAIREGASTRHVKFSNSDEEDGERAFQEKTAPRKLALFDSDDSETEETHPEFAIRPQFHGEKGHKLLELQSKIKDRRFHIDERFQDSEEEPEEIPDKNELTQEKERNLRILEKVLGYKPRARKTLQIVDMNQIRYDPSKSTHHKHHRSEPEDGALICKDDQRYKNDAKCINDETVDKTGADRESDQEESAEESNNDDGVDSNKETNDGIDNDEQTEDDRDDNSESVETSDDDDSESVETSDDDDSKSGKEIGERDTGDVDSSSCDKRKEDGESDRNNDSDNESNNDSDNKSEKCPAKAKREHESKDNRGTDEMKKKMNIKKNVDSNVKADIAEKYDETVVASSLLGNFFAGGETFSFFDDPALSSSKSPSGIDNRLAEEMETEEMETEEMETEEMETGAETVDVGGNRKDRKMNKEFRKKDVESKTTDAKDKNRNADCIERDASMLASTTATKRKLEAKPHFCITQDSILIGKAGKIQKRDREDSVNYTELRKEFQYLVRELHKKALRKQKQQISEKRKKNNKFTGSQKKKTKIFR